MIRVVLDTNIIVSAYLNEDGLPFRILKLALAGAIDLYASESIVEEYKELEIHSDCPAAAVYRALGRVAPAIQEARWFMNAAPAADTINHFQAPLANVFRCTSQRCCVAISSVMPNKNTGP
jgi:hypothetical protein